MYYQQPPAEAPVPMVPTRREKRFIEIVDPRTGVNVDLHEPSAARLKLLKSEVCMFQACCLVAILYIISCAVCLC